MEISKPQKSEEMNEPGPLFGGTVLKRPNECIEVFDRIIDGIRCRAIYHHVMGHFCGYIEIPKDTVHYSMNSYGDCELRMHGDASYLSLNGFPPGEEEKGIHVIGFDCMRSGDAPYPSSEIIKYIGHLCEGGLFRDLDYVWNECEKVVRQIKKA